MKPATVGIPVGQYVWSNAKANEERWPDIIITNARTYCRHYVLRNGNELRQYSYSPELNPDELLNQDVKTNAVGRQRPADQSQMISDVRSYLRGTQRRHDIVRAYFQEEHVRYAAQ